jgi:hypothetical protein
MAKITATQTTTIYDMIQWYSGHPSSRRNELRIQLLKLVWESGEITIGQAEAVNELYKYYSEHL